MSTEITTPEPRTLYGICDDLQTWIETLEMLRAIPPGTPKENDDREREIRAVHSDLERIGAELAGKTDSIAGVLRRIEAEQALIKAERERLAKRARAFERADEWLRGYVLSVMNQRGLKQLKTPQNTLFPRGSDAVVFTDAAKVPPEFLRATVTLPERLWRIAAQSLDIDSLQQVRHSTEAQKTEIKKAIKAGEDVPGCDLEFRTSLCLR